MSTKSARSSAAMTMNRPNASKRAKAKAAAILGSARSDKKARASRRNGRKHLGRK